MSDYIYIPNSNGFAISPSKSNRAKPVGGEKYFYDCQLTIDVRMTDRWEHYWHLEFVLDTNLSWPENKEKLTRLVRNKKWKGTVWRRTGLGYKNKTKQPSLDHNFPVFSVEPDLAFYEAYYNGKSIFAKDCNGFWRKCSLKQFKFIIERQKLDE